MPCGAVSGSSCEHAVCNWVASTAACVWDDIMENEPTVGADSQAVG